MTNNLEKVKQIEKEIKFDKEVAEYLDKKHDECHKVALDSFVPAGRSINKRVADLEYLKEVLTKLTERNINIDEKYKITNDIYLSVVANDSTVSFEFSLDGADTSLLYDHYIGSYSGMNEWLFHTVADTYNLYSGNSPYNYALGTTTLEDYIARVENRPDEFSSRRCNAEKVVNGIEKLIKFFTDKDKPAMKAIVRDLEFKFNNMKELAKEWER